MKQIDEENLNDLNNFLATRQGLEICSVNLADLSENYVEIIKAARANQVNLADLIKNSISVRPDPDSTNPVATATKTEPIPAATVKPEVAPAPKATDTPKVISTDSATVKAEPVKADKPATVTPQTVSPKSQPNEAAKPVSTAAKSAVSTSTAQKTSSTESNVKQPTTVTAKAAPAVATKITVFEGSVQPDKAKKNDIWYKTIAGGKKEAFKFDGSVWKPLV